MRTCETGTTSYPSFDVFFREFGKICQEDGRDFRGDLIEALLNFCDDRGIYIDEELDSNEKNTVAAYYKKYITLAESSEHEEILNCFKSFGSMYEDIIRHIVDASEGKPLWRELVMPKVGAFLEKLEKGTLSSAGVSWSWEKEGAVAYCATSEGTSIVLKASACPESIDWSSTVIINLMTSKEETEIRMFRKKKINIIEYCIGEECIEFKVPKKAYT